MLETRIETCLWNTIQKSKLIPGIISSYGLSIITLLTFGFAMIAIPISGANAINGGISYPYLETIQQFPRDYIWQYIAMVLMCAYLINFILIKELVAETVKLFFKIGLAFAIISTAILLINYYIQVNVVVISLINKEFEGIPLLTQYNPHGIFIALEELGYIVMIFSFACLIPVYWKKEYKTKAISIIYSIGVIITVIGFIIISIQYGLDKKDRFEVIVISVAWIVLIINGILIGKKLRKEIRT